MKYRAERGAVVRSRGKAKAKYGDGAYRKAKAQYGVVGMRRAKARPTFIAPPETPGVFVFAISEEEVRR